MGELKSPLLATSSSAIAICKSLLGSRGFLQLTPALLMLFLLLVGEPYRRRSKLKNPQLKLWVLLALPSVIDTACTINTTASPLRTKQLALSI